MNKTVLVAIFALSMSSVGCSHMMKSKKKTADAKMSKSEKVASKDMKMKDAKGISEIKGTVAYACKVGKDIRLVSVDKTPKRCEVYYKKLGETAQVAWAQATPQLCGEVKDRIKTNIESKGFKCDADIAKLTDDKMSADVAPKTVSQ